MIVPESHPDFPKMEEEILDFWRSNNINQKYRNKNNQSTQQFRFLDGPITANNPMGVHHAHGRTIKDFYQRYYNMRGYRQRFQNGFDCQGLWVEVEEEKDLGFNSKKDIENYGVDKFCLSCRARVERYSDVQSKQSQRLGMFMDWDHSYYTMSERNNLHIWHFLKKVHQKGWLYKGIDSMPWCARCGTAISQHELSDGGYLNVEHETVYVRFPIDRKITRDLSLPDTERRTSLLIWTTTPWTLLANVAVAVNPQVNYILIDNGEEYLLIAESRRNIITEEYTVVMQLKGSELLEWFRDVEADHYQGPFDSLEAVQRITHRVIPWEEVSDVEGSGLVHIAPGAGKEDFELHQLLQLDILAPIDEFGNYVEGYGSYHGKNVNDVRQIIYEDLLQDNKLYKKEAIEHSYPHCWRCKEELVFRTTEEWFISADEIRPLMKAASQKVNWIPTHAGLRMQDWLDNMGDWPISRKRYWGLALPIFESPDKSMFHVVGSKDELKQLAIEPTQVDRLPELHRPWIDEITLDGSKIKINHEHQNGVWQRVPDVGDCWLDAGIVPFSTVDYLTNKEYWQEWFPFDFITEYIAQVKLWFYATLFMSVTLKNRAPWQNVLATGFLVDEKGHHMHKSAGNAIDFDEAANKVGADSIRWLYLRERSANYHGTGNQRFGYSILGEVQRRFLGILWNTYRFVVQNALLDGVNWEVEQGIDSPNLLDQWILSRIENVVLQANSFLESYDSPSAAEIIESFITNDFSQWYIRRSRERIGPTAPDAGEKALFYQTCFYVLRKTLRLLAPFVPFITEKMYQNIRSNRDPESIHLLDWPSSQKQYINNELEQQMTIVREITEKAHSKRKEAGIKVRQPLQSMTITTPTDLALEIQLLEVIKSEVNVRNVLIESHAETNEIDVLLNTELSEQLIQEGYLRELIRQIQSMRRSAGYNFDQAISLIIFQDSTMLEKILAEYSEEFSRKLIIKEVVHHDLADYDLLEEIKINGDRIKVAIKTV